MLAAVVLSIVLLLFPQSVAGSRQAGGPLLIVAGEASPPAGPTGPFAPATPTGFLDVVPRSASPTPTTAANYIPIASTVLTVTPTPTFTPTPTPVPLPTPDKVVREVEIPVLMYHHIDVPGGDADIYRKDLSVSPEAFEEQMAYLQKAGYHSITLQDLVLHLQTGRNLPPKPVVLTFDDGYVDNYTVAYPILRRHGFTGAFFIITGFADRRADGYMSWDQITDLHAKSMEIGSHSYTHPDLRGRSDDYIVWQVLGSKEAIEARIGEPVRFFCYPSGNYDEEVVRILRRLGFWGATTLDQGKIQFSERPFELQRIRVRGGDDLARFIYKLEVLDW